MTTIDGAALVAQILPIAVLIIAVESRSAYRGIKDQKTRDQISAIALWSLVVASIGIIWCVSIVVFRIQFEGAGVWIADVITFVLFLVSFAGTTYFVGRMLRTMFKDILPKNPSTSDPHK